MHSVTDKQQLVSLARIDIDLEEEHRQLRKAKIVEQIEKADNQAAEAFGRICPKCNNAMYRHGKTRLREVWTLAGAVRIGLIRLRCSHCTYLCVPGSDIVGDGLLSSLAEILVELCRHNTFSTASRLLFKFYGIDIPVATLHSYIQRQAHYFSDEVAAAAAALYEDGIAPERDIAPDVSRPLYLSIDEGLVREWSWYHNKADKDATKRFVVAYCAVFFDGRQKISGPKAQKRRYQLTNRFGHASATTDIDQFFSELVMLSYRRGYIAGRTLFILIDGARYLNLAIETYFPHAIPLLDLYHLKKRIFDLIDIETEMGAAILEAVHRYDPDALIWLIKRYPLADMQNAEGIAKLVGYIKRNAQALKNHRHPKTRVHGSASAEKAVDLMVARRFKNRGMSWTEQGCEVLLHFQVLDYNGKLDEFWDIRHRQTSSLPASSEESAPTNQSRVKPKRPKGVSHYYHQVHLPDSERSKCPSLN